MSTNDVQRQRYLGVNAIVFSILLLTMPNIEGGGDVVTSYRLRTDCCSQKEMIASTSETAINAINSYKQNKQMLRIYS